MNSGTISNPKIWVPYMNTKDCSQGFCSLYCPQWCYILLPPPPPYQELLEQNSGSYFSPLVITIIGVLAGAFLLVSYYAILSKYCNNRSSSARSESGPDPNTTSGDDPVQDPWYVTSNGLDDALIKSIEVFKYNKGGDLTNVTNCSVCLTEFDENESLRLLPKCSHAFHVPCIDTWLKSHSNCPLCRANVACVGASCMLSPQNAPSVESLSQSTGGVENSVVAENVAINIGDGESERTEGPKSPLRDMGGLGIRDVVIEIREDDEINGRVIRSVSMDCIRNIEESCSNTSSSDSSSSSNSRELNGVMSPGLMNRSYSSGRLLFTKCGEKWNSLIPF